MSKLGKTDIFEANQGILKKMSVPEILTQAKGVKEDSWKGGMQIALEGEWLSSLH